jgi:hypothetical protein
MADFPLMADISGLGQNHEVFFFEKKKQKTFARW